MNEKMKQTQNEAISRAKRMLMKADMTGSDVDHVNARSALQEAAFLLGAEDVSTLKKRKKLLKRKRGVSDE